MFLGRIKGHVVSSVKDKTINGQRLLIVEPLKVIYSDANDGANGDGGAGGFEPTGRAIVAMDPLGCGTGQLVLISQGSSARMADGMKQVPTDAVIVGIVDEAVVGEVKLK
ncbi:MAG: ethanolamine utilization protein EutN [Phycisphaeraceae bacterium]|nr:ethanolamine utilization protein EutN [Phycisphaeraceae bacterium]